MPFRKLKLLPGVNLEASETLNQTQFSLTNLVRFYGQLIQKLGGWQALSTNLFVGTCRGLHGWADILGNPYLAVGTEQRLEVLIGGALNDITPIVSTTNQAPAFSTLATSNVVTVEDSSYSPDAGDWTNIETQVSVGGVIIFGFYQVQTVIDATHYTILVASAAPSTVTNGGAVPSFTTSNGFATVSVVLDNHSLTAGALFSLDLSTSVGGLSISGIYSVTSVTDTNTFVITAGTAASSTATVSENAGNVRIQYLLPTGFPVSTSLTGYGIGDYGLGDYGISSGDQVLSPLRQWSLDHWGQDLIASPTNGAIYYWQPPTISPAIPLSGSSPLYSISVFVMSQVQIIVALGAETGGTQEPLLVRWSDAGDFTDWTPTATNQAGSFVIPTGTRLVGGLAVGLGALLWTDVDLWSMTYEGLPFVFGFNRVAAACGLISQRSAGIVGTIVIWLSTRGFFTYTLGGGVTPTECPVWDFLFNNIDFTQVNQTNCAVNALFNEMAWFFPLATTSPLYSENAPLGYVKFNYVEQVWDYGQSSQYQRTAWIGKTAVGNPIGADLDGLLQQHEIGFDANGVGMEWSWQTGFFDIMEGEEFAFVDMMIPDNVTSGNPVISYTVYPTYYPNQPATPDGPFMTTPTTRFFSPRVRGRQIAIGASGSDLGTFNRLGALRYRYAPDGRN